jgi:Mrp family chromosome partitioning ATPase
MSLIETAVKKAKEKLADTGLHKAVPDPGVAQPPPTAPRRSRGPVLDEAAVAARAAQARVLPVAHVDQEAMERNGVLAAVHDNAALRAYRILRTRIHQRMQVEGWHSLAVTATGIGEGKTLTSINLAIALARDPNTWVYLVDLDLQRPAVASYLGLEFDKGLSDYLAGTATFEDILYSPGVERLCVIPNQHAFEASSDMLGAPRIGQLCNSLAAEVPRPVVIFDMPPLLLSDDMMKFSHNVDCTLFVVNEGGTPRASLQRANEILQEMNLLGVVLNRSAEREESGYY